MACNTYITDPVRKLFLMFLMLFVITIANVAVKPYKDRRANITATVSYAANMCIATMNLWKTGLVTFGCHTNCSYQAVVAGYLDLFEKVLIYLPVGAVVVWVFFTGIQTCRPKSKQE